MNDKIQMTFGVLFLSALVALCVGWVMNIIDLINYTGEVTTLFIIKVVGIFVAPLGGVLGLIG